jgi:hypothetical protein
LAPGSQPGAIFVSCRTRDTAPCASYIAFMRTLIIVALFALLAFAVWFAGAAWERLGGGPIPVYGYFAIGGGILFSLLLGGALMGLVFYSSRHGYDDINGEEDRR